MDPRLLELLRRLTGQDDLDLLRALLDAVSVSVHEARGELAARGWAFADPGTDTWPEPAELELAAERLAEGALLKGGAISALGAVGGLPAIPPELAADIIHVLRLAQRMGVIYGFDPATDKGRILLRRAMEAAYGLPPPEPARPALRAADLPALIARRLPEAGAKAAALATKAAARRAATWPLRAAVARVPGLGPGLAARAGRRVLRGRAARIHEVYRAAFEGPPPLHGGIEEAVILRERA